MNLKPVTPLRRSERLRRPTAKAIGSSPGSSPGTAAYVDRSINPRSRVFSSPSGQTDSDSTLRNTSSSKSSGSCTEDTVGDATDSMALVAHFPPKLYQAYQGLAPILRYSNAELMKRVSLPSFSQRPTRPHSFPPSRHIGHSHFKCLSQRAKPVPAGRHWHRVLLPMVRVRQFHRTLQSDCESHRCQESSSATENAETRKDRQCGDGEWPRFRRGINMGRDERRALAGSLEGPRRTRVLTAYV
jgi:hypothetical protein